MSQSDKFVMPTYGRFPINFVRGKACHLFDENDNDYLDFHAGIAVNSLGHCHPHLQEILADQSKKLWHISNLYPIGEQSRLAERLCANSFADKVFFCNSGVEALEGMIKLARRYHFVNNAPHKWRIITTQSSFHGRSLATLAAAKNPKHYEGFGPLIDGFDQVPLNNGNMLREKITDETAAILLEPLQGEGGINIADSDYLQFLRKTCDEYGILLLLDEVQCGNARTGKLWAHEWANIKPDAIATAKGLGGGFPIGAFLASDKAASGMTPGTHGSTFGGNPLATAVANGVLDVILSDNFLQNVQEKGQYLKDKVLALISDHPAIYQAHLGRGLMQGIKIHPTYAVGDVVSTAFQHKLLLVGAGNNVARLLPPLIIEKDDIDKAIDILHAVALDL